METTKYIKFLRRYKKQFPLSFLMRGLTNNLVSIADIEKILGRERASNAEKKHKAIQERNIIVLGSLSQGIRNIEPNAVISEIKAGSLSNEDIQKVAHPSLRNTVESLISKFEAELYAKAIAQNNETTYLQYLFNTLTYQHFDEIAIRLFEPEDKTFNSCVTENDYLLYLKNFPDGYYVNETKKKIELLEWATVSKSGDIDKIKDFQQNHPGVYDNEANKILYNLEDEKYWAENSGSNEINALEKYLAKYPNGIHATEARQIINNRRSHEEIIGLLSSSPNAIDAAVIQEYVNVGKLTWGDVESFFGKERTSLIKEYERPEDIKFVESTIVPNDRSTSIFFWGPQGCGKTCLIGTFLSSMEKKGLIEYVSKSKLYFDHLTTLFKRGTTICLPAKTDKSCVQAMECDIIDDEDKRHSVNVFDIPGEIFEDIYRHELGLPLSSEQEELVSNIISLFDFPNKQIHFFVVDYGVENREIDMNGAGINATNLYISLLSYLNRKKVMKKKAVGIYLLLSKADELAPNQWKTLSKNEQGAMLQSYINENLCSLHRNLSTLDSDAGIKGYSILGISIGEVFAKKFCKVNFESMELIRNEILAKTPKEKTGFLKKLMK